MHSVGVPLRRPTCIDPHHLIAGKEERDYLGRTYMHIPTDVDGVNLRGESGNQECFVPKKCIHTWSGHTKGVSRIQLFPKSGHLLLSASLDTRIKVRAIPSFLPPLTASWILTASRGAALGRLPRREMLADVHGSLERGARHRL